MDHFKNVKTRKPLTKDEMKKLFGGKKVTMVEMYLDKDGKLISKEL